MSAVAVGGMHRSGTSMTAHLLHVMGVYLGDEADLTPVGPDNPDGRWEHPALVEINDEILHGFGGGWDLPVELPDGWVYDRSLAPLRERAHHVIRQLEGRETWGWADPRNSLTLPFWRVLAPQIKVVICLRHPLEVALSLQRRGMFSYSLSMELWRIYNERILACTDPSERLVTAYDQYFDNGVHELARLAEFVGLPTSNEVVTTALTSVRTNRRHWRLELAELREANVAAEVIALYRELRREAGMPERRSDWRGVATPGHDGAGSDHAPSHEARRDRRVERAHVENAMLRARLSTLQPTLTEREAEIDALKGQLKETEAALDGLRYERDALDRRVEDTELRQDALVRLVAGLGDQIDRRGNEAQELLYDLHGFQTGVRTTPPPQGKAHRYRQTTDRIRDAVRAHVPQDATVVVASHGDEEVLKLYGRRAWHFPRLLDGTYLGHHPASSEAAIVHLRAVEALGATHFVLPADMSWWLDHYAVFRRHLERHCRVVYRNDDRCQIYFLLERPRGAPAIEADALEQLVDEFHARFDRDPAILDWRTTRDLARELPQLPVFSAPEGTDRLDTLDYLDHTVDVVAVQDGSPARLREAERVASVAVVVFDDPKQRSGARAYGRLPPRIDWREAGTSQLPSVSIVVPCYDGVDHTRVCIETLSRTMGASLDVQVIAVDDASRDGTERYLREASRRLSWLSVLRNRSNEGYLASVNRGGRIATGDILIFLNNDTILLPGWLPPLLRTFGSRSDVGVVGGKLLYPDGRVQEAGGVVFADGSAAKFGAFDPAPSSPLYEFVREVDYCSGALLATPREVFEELDGFDPEYGPGYYEDTDYCFRVRESGRRVLYQPASVIVHLEGATAGRDVSTGMKQHQMLNHRRFVERWADALATRPARPPEPFDAGTLFELAAGGSRSIGGV
jgi:GT2 family glycosyltransferase